MRISKIFFVILSAIENAGYGYALDSTKVNFYNTCPYERIPYDF